MDLLRLDDMELILSTHRHSFFSPLLVFTILSLYSIQVVRKKKGVVIDLEGHRKQLSYTNFCEGATI
jgi:hypothetical protein